MPTYEYNNHAYSLYDLRRQFPHRSFPAAPTLDDITPLGVTTVPDPEPVRQFSKQIHQFLPKITIQNLFSVFGNPNNVIPALPDYMI